MCGRYQMSVKKDDIVIRFKVEVYEKLYRPSYNCAPSQKLPVITNLEQSKLNYFRWGLIPFWAKDIKIGNKMINAKAETIDQKPSFKNSFKRKRCLVPGNGFYEWRKEGNEKIPCRIFLKNNELFSFAGIWDTWKDAEGREINSFSIITTEPNELMEKIHRRMPVILHESSEKSWLNQEDPAILKELLKPYPSEKMLAYPVSKAVNSPVNNSEEVVKQEGELVRL
ncbi:MAG: SOS response-associated peptidase [Bacteroidota bacterium]|nr:SOS response-associated peptidase [Bacteroidota bacterium]